MTEGRSPMWASGPFFCLLLLACGTSTQPSAEDRRQLDNAEEMLNSAPQELSGIDTGEVAEPERNEAAD